MFYKGIKERQGKCPLMQQFNGAYFMHQLKNSEIACIYHENLQEVFGYKLPFVAEDICIDYYTVASGGLSGLRIYQ